MTPGPSHDGAGTSASTSAKPYTLKTNESGDCGPCISGTEMLYRMHIAAGTGKATDSRTLDTTQSATNEYDIEGVTNIGQAESG
eukprot:CAMPEP_0115613092 /NCGR_PEP_ID=MMETSP0272-20121206/21399_1 /TAXON_ID=71861 /ORGANISM="Scrippsiella trochoidea, Strain CCMP3099" /LENGTH=83 /DNA_ID=CAMNT_0003048903 /DNA_START=294 /DNA_END=545 /DNA_ORIENTATION=+